MSKGLKQVVVREVTKDFILDVMRRQRLSWSAAKRHLGICRLSKTSQGGVYKAVCVN